MDLASYSVNHIDAIVKFEDGGTGVRITGIYGEPNAQRRHITWNLLRTLRSDNQQPWFVGGDYNVVGTENQGR